MTKLNQDITDYLQGDRLDIDVIVTDPDGVVVDISGSAIEWVLVDTGVGVIVKKTTDGGGVTITDGPGGEFSVALKEADTEDIDPGRYHHEAEIDLSSGPVTVLTGRFEIVRSYT